MCHRIKCTNSWSWQRLESARPFTHINKVFHGVQLPCYLYTHGSPSTLASNHVSATRDKTIVLATLHTLWQVTCKTIPPSRQFFFKNLSSHEKKKKNVHNAFHIANREQHTNRYQMPPAKPFLWAGFQYLSNMPTLFQCIVAIVTFA